MRAKLLALWCSMEQCCSAPAKFLATFFARDFAIGVTGDARLRSAAANPDFIFP
jgi:hypothetical protein